MKEATLRDFFRGTGRVLYDWASPEFTWELTPANVRMFRDWLTGEVQAPSEPEVTTDTMSGSGFLKVLVQTSPPP